MTTGTLREQTTAPSRPATGVGSFGSGRSTVPDGAGPGDSDRPWLLMLGVAALFVVFLVRLTGGWLLLLDWAPGPSAGTLAGPDLPVGAALSALTKWIAGWSPSVLGWSFPAAAVLFSAVGGARLARCWRGPAGVALSWSAAAVGGCVAAANPFIAARVYSGQIGVLWGYAVLWWLVAALVRGVDRSGTSSWLVPGLWLAVAAACTAHLIVIGSVVVLVTGGLHHRRHGGRAALARVAGTLGVGGVITAALLAPTLLDGGRSLGEPGGADAVMTFASGGSATTLWARALGGAAFWRPLPAGALTGFGLIVGLAWCATLVARNFGRGESRDLRHLLGACALVAVASVYLTHGPTFGPWVKAVGSFWPAGLLREPGKMLMLATLAPACGAAAATQQFIDSRRARAQVRRSGGSGTDARADARAAARTGAVTGLISVTAVAMVWAGFLGRLAPSTYPDQWQAIAATVAVDRCLIAVLGDGAYTDPGFTGGRVVAHPAQGFFGARAVVSTDPMIPGLDPKPPANAAQRWSAAANLRALGGRGSNPDPSTAAASGIGWVFVNRPVDRTRLVSDLDGAGFVATRYSDAAGLWRVPGGCS